MELRKGRVELAAVVEGALETSRPLIEAGSHELTVSLPAEPIYLEADLVRLAEVFSNLLNNAAKYTEERSHIWLTAEPRGADVLVTVKDNGIGIAPELLPRVFELFAQGYRAMMRSQDGLGIGLSLVKALVELHGGSIEAHSDGLGRGSEFLVRLPAAVETSVPERPGRSEHDEQVPVVKSRILVVDIWEQPSGRGMYLVAQTGWGQEDDRRRTEEAGFNHHMVKPVDPAAHEVTGFSMLGAGKPVTQMLNGSLVESGSMRLHQAWHPVGSGHDAIVLRRWFDEVGDTQYSRLVGDQQAAQARADGRSNPVARAGGGAYSSGIRHPPFSETRSTLRGKAAQRSPGPRHSLVRIVGTTDRCAGSALAPAPPTASVPRPVCRDRGVRP